MRQENEPLGEILLRNFEQEKIGKNDQKIFKKKIFSTAFLSAQDRLNTKQRLNEGAQDPQKLLLHHQQQLAISEVSKLAQLSKFCR